MASQLPDTVVDSDGLSDFTGSSVNTSTIGSIDIGDAVRRFMKRSAQIAILHLTGIEAKTTTLFFDAGISDLFRDITRSDGPMLGDIVRDSNHPMRVQIPYGPLVVRRDETDPSLRYVLTASELLFSPHISEREAAVIHLDLIASQHEPFLLTDRTQAILKQQREQILSSEPTKWRRASLSLHDATENDWLYALAGLRQSFALQYEKGVETFIPKLTHPSIQAIESIDLVWWEPANQYAEIEAKIVEIANVNPDLHKALDTYWQNFGHVPLVTGIGMGRLVLEWIRAYPDLHVNYWDLMWEWADSTGSPVSRYHVLHACLSTPSWIPAYGALQFWSEFAAIYAGDQKDEASPEQWVAAWKLRCELATHYCRHFASHIPWNEGERFALLGWWLAERLAALFLDDNRAIMTFRKGITGIEARQSRETSLFLHPEYSPSALAYATIGPGRVWSRSLTGSMGESGTFGALPRVPDTFLPILREKLETGLALDLVQDPCPEGLWGNPKGYAFSLPCGPGVRTYTAIEATHEAQLLSDLDAGVKEYRGTKYGRDLVDSLTVSEGGEDVVAAFYLHAICYAHKYPLDEMMATLKGEESFGKAVLTCREELFEMIVDAYLEAAVQHQGSARSLLPHVLATACETSPDVTRHDLLFTAVVACCASTDTVSALRRLLTGPKRAQHLEIAAQVHAHLISLSESASPWAAARVRPIVAALTF